MPIFYLSVFISITFLISATAADARGFGGGGRGGGYRGDGFDRGFGDRGLGDRDFGDRFGDRGYGGLDDDPARDTFHDDIPSDSVWNRDGDLPTDGGFGRVAGPQARNFYGRGTYPMSDAGFRDQAALVRNGFNDRGYFGPRWFGGRDGWWYPGWGNDWAWDGADWGDIATYLGMSAATAPVYYDYGQNITYQGDNVYYGAKPLEQQDAYYEQASVLAQQGASAEIKPTPKGWKALGVFSVVQNGQTDSSSLFQLAINKLGQLKGNYYNTITDELKPITGSVDKKNSRVAWTVAGKNSVVYDTGLGNLMKDQAPLLVHFSKSKTEQFMLVRMRQSNIPTKTSRAGITL